MLVRFSNVSACSLQELSGLVADSGPLFVPDERGVLTPAEQLVFNDVPWLGPQQEAAHLVHPKISFEVRGMDGKMGWRSGGIRDEGMVVDRR